MKSITVEEIHEFLKVICDQTKQSTKYGRKNTVSALFNFIKFNWELDLINPCESLIVKRIYHKPKLLPPTLYDKEAIDEFTLPDKHLEIIIKHNLELSIN